MAKLREQMPFNGQAETKQEKDRTISLAQDIYIVAVNNGKNGSSELKYLAEKALEQASAFWSVVDEQRPQL